MNVFTQIPLAIWICFIALIGLLVGSFLNVVIYRLPKILEADWKKGARECLELPEVEAAAFSLSMPKSHCPYCKAPVRWWQNIPLLSFMVLRGKCHHCQHPISWRYPLVELLSAILSGVLAWHFGVSVALLGSLLLTWMLLACFFIDYDHQLLPDQLTLPLVWLGLVFNLWSTFATLPDAVIGAIVGYGFFWVVYWLFKLATHKEGLGYGDFKLLAALGAWLGWQLLLPMVIVSGVLSIVVAVILRLSAQRDLQKPMAYGPSLVIAGWLALMWGEPLLHLYLTWAQT